VYCESGEDGREVVMGGIMEEGFMRGCLDEKG
jgi:hypothetical protein